MIAVAGIEPVVRVVRKIRQRDPGRDQNSGDFRRTGRHLLEARFQAEQIATSCPDLGSHKGRPVAMPLCALSFRFQGGASEVGVDDSLMKSC